MKSKKTYPSKTYKVCSIILYILSILCLIIGIPTFPFGGFLFVIFGVLCFIFARSYSKMSKSPSKTNPQAIDTPTVKSTTIEKNNSLQYGLDYVYVNKSSKSYHYDLHCRSVTSSFDMITRDEARARGLKPCKHCNTF